MKRRGMTLIEVVVALAIFTSVVAVLSQAVTIALNVMADLDTDRSREQEFRFAMREILQVSGREEFEDGGDIETLGSGTITWQATIEETEMLDLFKVMISMEWLAQGDYLSGPVVREQEVYLLRPAWSYADERSSLLQDKTTEYENRFGGL